MYAFKHFLRMHLESSQVLTLSCIGAGLLFGGTHLVISHRDARENTRILARICDNLDQIQLELHAIRARLSDATPQNEISRRNDISLSHLEPENNSPRASILNRRPSSYRSPNDSDFEDAYATVQESPRKLTFKSDTFGDFFNNVDKLHEGNEDLKLQAYDILEAKFRDYPENPELLWRLARSLVVVAELDSRAGNQEGKKMKLYRAKQLAEKCLEVNPSADAHKWFAIIVGSIGQFEGTSDKIKNGYLFKEHIDKAIQCRPNESTLHHLRGRWCYEVSQLSWLERNAASALFASPPKSSVQEALNCFLQADKLEERPWKDNALWVAKCLISMKNVKEGMRWVQKALNAAQEDSDDPSVIKELLNLKEKYAYAM